MCACGLASLFFMPGLSPHCTHCTQNTQCALTPAHQIHSTHYSFSPIFPVSPDFSPCHSLPSLARSLQPVNSHSLLLWVLIHDWGRQLWKNGGVCVCDSELGFPVCQQGGKLTQVCAWQRRSLTVCQTTRVNKDHTLTDTHALGSVCGVLCWQNICCWWLQLWYRWIWQWQWLWR